MSIFQLTQYNKQLANICKWSAQNQQQNIQSTLQFYQQPEITAYPSMSYQYVQSQDDCLDDLETYQNLSLLYSGKSFTQLGLSQECLNYDYMKYGLVQFFNSTTKVFIPVSMGVCLPKTCNSTVIQNIADAVLSDKNITAFTKYVESPQEFNPQFGPAFIITVTLLSICALAVLTATFFQDLAKKNHILGAFSLRKSAHTFQYKQHKFNIFNGIKSICMMWVIFGHMYSVRIQNIVNALTVAGEVQTPFYLLVLASFFAVDVFFYIGGFLVAYSFLRNSMKSIMKYPLAIVHRILRFWPSYIMAMMIYYGIIIHTGSGPIWYKLQTAGQIDYCDSMWKSVIFVDNIVDNGERMCMGWGWYLQNDMQIFIFSIPILYLYCRNRKISFVLIGLLTTLSLVFNFVEVQVNQYVTVAHRVDFSKWSSYFPNVYIKPWVRCPPYLYGLFLGLLYMQYVDEQKNKKQTKGFFSIIKQKLHKSRILKNVTQLIGLSFIIFIVFIPRTLQVGHKWPQVVHSFYLTFSKLFFVIGVSLLVTPTLVGVKNDLFFFLMDTKAFNFMAKISFWTYLIHYMVVEHVCYSQKLDYYYDVSDVLTLYIPVAILAMAYGLVGTVLIQIPFAKLEKMLFEGKKKEKKLEPLQEAPDVKVQTLLNESVVSGGSIASIGNLSSSTQSLTSLNESA